MPIASPRIVFILVTLCTQLYCLTEHNTTPIDLNAHHRLTPIQSVESTLEADVSRNQAALFTEQHFLNVFDKNTLDAWGIDWNIFQDASLAFDAPQKLSAISVIDNKVTCLLMRPHTEKLMALCVNIENIKNQIESAHIHYLSQQASNYFTTLYNSESIDFFHKQNGRHLGECIMITFSDQKKRLYHVKTHAKGRMSHHHTEPKLVNPQDLLAYKIFELLGFGCEVHFFEKSPEDVYIATLDANFIIKENIAEATKNQNADENENENEEEEEAIWQTQMKIIAAYTQERNNANWHPENMNTDEDVVHFMDQYTTLDLFTRIMLCDALNKPKNFGLTACVDSLPQLKVINCNVIDSRKLVLQDSDFEDFLVGDGLYDCANLQPAVAYTLKHRTKEIRAPHALNIINTNLQKLQQAVQQAYQFVLTYVHQPVFANVLAELEEKLRIYVQAIQDNTAFLKAKLEAWTQEQEQAQNKNTVDSL